jgi:pyridoxal/pyridoxine/pyridoxamine kinase
MRRSTKKVLRRSWGYLLLGFVVYAWFSLTLGPAVIGALSGAVVVYTLFQAPMWCCAVTRGGELCRHNAYGILMGCYLREHKWQKLTMAVDASRWGQLGRRVLSSFGGQAAAITAVAGLISAMAAVMTLVTS